MVKVFPQVLPRTFEITKHRYIPLYVISPRLIIRNNDQPAQRNHVIHQKRVFRMRKLGDKCSASRHDMAKFQGPQTLQNHIKISAKEADQNPSKSGPAEIKKEILNSRGVEIETRN